MESIRFIDGGTIHFGVEEFTNLICATDCCFICGSPHGTKKFNDEHVIPRWVLKRYDLFARKITLPNGEAHRYGTYVMRCCLECNSLLGERLETPISELMSGCFEEINNRLSEPGELGNRRISALYVWLCLIFVKTHMMDRELREYVDFRKGDASIAHRYDWHVMHHLYCVARMPYVEGAIDPRVVGTILWFRIDDPMMKDEFDYFDLTYDNTVVIRLGDIGIVAVLNDARACSLGLQNVIQEVHGQTLTIVQLRELGARLALANRDLINRPSFFTIADKNQLPVTVRLGVRHDPHPNFSSPDRVVLGQLMELALGSFANNLRLTGSNNPTDAWQAVISGEMSFLLDEKRSFMRRLEINQAPSD